MTLDLTKEIQTRDGRKAVLVEKHKDNFTAAIYGPHLVRGSHWVLYYYPADTDNIINTPVKHKLEGWLNLTDGGGVIKTADHLDEEEFYDFFGKNRIACIDLSKYGIEFETGEGI